MIVLSLEHKLPMSLSAAAAAAFVRSQSASAPNSTAAQSAASEGNRSWMFLQTSEGISGAGARRDVIGALEKLPRGLAGPRVLKLLVRTAAPLLLMMLMLLLLMMMMMAAAMAKRQQERRV
jgi:hypothetical protein